MHTSPRQLLEAAAAAAQDAYDAGQVRLTVEAAGPLPDIHVDPERMGQVLANLLENALRHTPPGGSVHLSASRPDHHWVELDVTDTGRGSHPSTSPTSSSGSTAPTPPAAANPAAAAAASA